MIYSAYKLNKQSDNIQSWCIPFPIWNQSIGPCPVLTVACSPAYRFLRKQARWSGIPISLRIRIHLVIYITHNCQSTDTVQYFELPTQYFESNILEEKKSLFFCVCDIWLWKYMHYIHFKISVCARTWKQPRCPSIVEWIKKLWCIYTNEYYSTI